MNRIRVEWSGAPVTGPGLTTFYTSGGTTTLPASVKTFFTAVKATFPAGITWTIPSAGDVIRVEDGQLTSAWTSSGGGTVTSGGTGTNWAYGAGGRIVWETAGIYRGHRVKGTTFMVPLVIDYYSAAAGVSSVATTNWTSAALALLAAESLVVYSRKVPTRTKPDGTVVPGTDGVITAIAGVLVPTKETSLKSRRL